MDEPVTDASAEQAVDSTKSRKKNRRRLQLYFDADVRQALEHYCIDRRITMSEYVNDLVAKNLPKKTR